MTGLGPFALAPIIGAVSVAVLSFLGFDAIASFAEESAGSERDVGRAILVCLVAAGTVFILQTWLAALVSPVDPGELAARPERQGTAFYDITRAALGPWLAIVLSITKAVGPAFAGDDPAQAAAARLLFGMARDGRLPGALASVDAQHGVPRTALVTAAALTMVVSVWAARRTDGLDVLVSIVDVGALAVFTLLHASVLEDSAWQKRDAVRPTHYVVPILGAIVTVWVIAEARPVAHAVAAVWLAAGMAARYWRW